MQRAFIAFTFSCLAGLVLLSPVAAGAQDSWAGRMAPGVFLPTGSSSSSSLVGYWSDNAYSGEMVDGSGNVVKGTYSGQWYRFYSNGHYVYTIVSQGQILRGVAFSKGTYSVSSNGWTVRLHKKLESWYPFADDPSHQKKYKNKPAPDESTIKIQHKSANQILIDGFSYHRVSN